MKKHANDFAIAEMALVLGVSPSGYYHYCNRGLSKRATEDHRLLGLIKAGWLYVAVVMDLYSRKIIGLSMGKRITRELVISAFLQAMLMRGYPKELLYHSDRGSQYTSRAFQTLMKLYKIKVSMSAKGNCYDNAAMESFFHTLKLECTDDFKFETRNDAINAIFDYIQIFYNNERLHSYLGYNTPNDFEK